MADLYESPRLAWSTSESQDMQDYTVKPILRKQQRRTRRKRSRKRRRKRKTDRKTKKLKAICTFYITHILQ